MKALLLDDEAPSRKALRGKLDLFCPQVREIYEASTVDEAWELLLGRKHREKWGRKAGSPQGPGPLAWSEQ